MKKNIISRFTALTLGALTAITTITSLTECQSASDAAKTEKPVSQEMQETASQNVVWEKNLLDPANPVKVKFYSYSYSSAAFGTGFQTLMDNFNNGVGKDKGVILEIVADDSGTKAGTDIKAGLQVDMIQSSFRSLDGDVSDLGLKAYADVFPAEEMEAHFEGIPDNCLDLGKINEDMYGLAFTFSTPMLYVNSNLLKEAGIDPSVAPKDWDEMYEWSQTIKEKTGKYGLSLSPTNSNGWVTDSIFYSAGATVLNADRTAVEFASDAGVKAIESWKRFYHDGCAIGGSDMEAMQAFASGEAAMHIQSTSVYSSMKAAAKQGGWELTGYPMPGFDGNPSVPTNSGSCIVVRPDNEQKAQAIWEVIKYVTGKEGYTIITSQIGYLPLRPELADDPEYLKNFVDENPMIRANIERLQDIVPTAIWPGKNAAQLETLYADMAIKALTTEADVAETLKEYQDEMNQYIK